MTSLRSLSLSNPIPTPELRWVDRIPYGLALLAIAAAVFSRLIVSWGFPSVLNFVHFPIALLAFATTAHPKTEGPRRMVAAIAGFTLLAMFSGIINSVELIRTLSATFLWTEPLVIAYVIWVALVRSGDSRSFGRAGRYVFVFAILAQVVMMTIQIPRQLSLPGGDEMQGTFLDSGIGAHVAPAVVFIGLILVLESATLSPRMRWPKLLLAAYGLFITTLALARVVTAIYAGALLVGTMILGGRHSGKRWSAVAISLVIGIGLWVTFPLLADVPNIERQLPGWEVKVSGIKRIVEDMQGNVSYVVAGQGPGTTLSRVAMQTPEANLNPASPVASLGLGTTEFTYEIVYTRRGVAIAQSSAFTPSSTLVGVLGDLGAVGFVLYVAMWLPILKSTRESARGRGRYGVSVIVIATAALGTIQTWLEEPGYVLLVALLLALVAGGGFYPPSQFGIENRRDVGATGQPE